MGLKSVLFFFLLYAFWSSLYPTLCHSLVSVFSGVLLVVVQLISLYNDGRGNALLLQISLHMSRSLAVVLVNWLLCLDSHRSLLSHGSGRRMLPLNNLIIGSWIASSPCFCRFRTDCVNFHDCRDASRVLLQAELWRCD
jgi:hypothetical protein